MPWSDDLRLMARPFQGYRELAVEEGGLSGREALRSAGFKALFLLFVIGGFISITSAGRLVAFHVASTMVFWSFAPLAQLAVFASVTRLLAPTFSPGRALSLYLGGHGPWLLLMTLIAGVCLLAPDVYAAARWMLDHGVLPGLLLVATLWAGVLTFACFRAGIGLSRARAALATGLFYLGYVGVIVGYYLVTNQIQPQLRWWPW